MNRRGAGRPDSARDAGFDCVTLAEHGFTVLLVTHDVSEAVAMGTGCY